MSLHRIALMLMIASGVLTTIEAEAQARGRPLGESRPQSQGSNGATASYEEKLAGLHAWLDRLVGQFEASSSFDMAMVNLGAGGGYTIVPDPPQLYSVQCVAIGSGAGVLCLFEATGRTVGELPLARLFGVDAERLLIRALDIDNKGYAKEIYGPLNEDTVILARECRAAENCVGSVTTRISASSRSRFVHIYVESNIKMQRSFQTSRFGSRTELRRR